MSGDHATQGGRNRSRGARAEQRVVTFLRSEGWPDARRYLAGDGRQPGDLDWHALVTCEIKDVAGSAWPAWCRQASAASRPGMVPVVVRRTRGVPDVGEWECRADWEAWVTVFGGLPRPIAAGVEVDGRPWLRTTVAELVAAVRGVDS